MGYCNVQDVQALRPQILFSAGSKPSTADVQIAIDQVSDHINGIMAGLNFIVPLLEGPSPISFRYIRACVMWAVAGLMEDAQRAAITGQPGSQQVHNDYKEQYDGCIKAITEKPLILSDAPQGTGDAAKRSISSFFTHNQTDDQQAGIRVAAKGTTAEPRFRIAQEF